MKSKCLTYEVIAVEVKTSGQQEGLSSRDNGDLSQAIFLSATEL
jgi:hypothetical protein